MGNRFFWVILLITLTAVFAPAQPARIALIQLEGAAVQSSEPFLASALAAIDAAGKMRPDLIVLPEAINLGPGLDLTYAEVALDLETEWLQWVSHKAAEYNSYIVFPIIEKRDGKLYNSAPVFGRSGELVGVYRKTHEPRVVIEEQQVTVGNEWPVFDLDIGRVGILICYDTITPEPAQVYGLLDVDLILFPHLIGIKSNGDQFDLRTRARALDACVHLASVGWARPQDAGELGPLSATCWIDYEGRATAQAAKDTADMVILDIDLRQPRITENLGVWGKAEWKKVYWGERRPHLYRILCEDNTEWRSWAPEESF